MTLASWLIALVAFALGCLVAWLAAKAGASSRLALGVAELERVKAERDGLQAERRRVDEELSGVRAALADEQRLRTVAETQLAAAQELTASQARFVSDVKLQLEGSYAKLSQEALKAAVDQLTTTVKPHLDGTKGEIVSSLDAKKVEIESLLVPLREMLDRYQAELQSSEKSRFASMAGLQEQIRALLDAQERTQRETAKLSSALRVPNVRGSWGESSLRRCVELAGMSEFCKDFTIQETFEGEDGKRLRPDMVIYLPNDRVIAVDSKAPIDAYLEAAAESDESRRKLLLDQHAKNLRRHIEQLSRKEYQSSIGESLDFTVLFLGGEQFLSSALMVDPTIFEFAVERKIFLASPTVLLPLLRAVEAGWKAERQEESAREALAICLELYERFVKVFEHIEGVGDALNASVRKYNDAIRSTEQRLLPKARQLQSYVSSTRAVPDVEQLELHALDAPKAIADAKLVVKPTLVPLSDEAQERVRE